VSHQPEREQKNCLNCGIMVKGRYCQRCGQENIVTKQSFGAFAKHFIYDIFHFDGKFFHTLKDLILKPGTVPLAYISGKRMHYLDPVRMYLFTSAVFFLVFFSIAKPKMEDTGDRALTLSNTERIETASELLSSGDDSSKAFVKYAVNKLLDTSVVIILYKDTLYNDSVIRFHGRDYQMEAPTKKQLMERDEKASWIDRLLKRKARKLSFENPDRVSPSPVLVINDFLHRIPYLLFISLPFFALILKLIYIRRREFFYSDHVIFTLYHYILTFILLLFVIGLRQLGHASNTGIFTWLPIAILFYWLIFLYKAMRRFYRQGRGKTLVKFFILNILGLLSLILLGFLFLVISAIEF
jgi:hypothetical protein